MTSVLITGAGRNIGKAFAFAFAARGYDVILNGRTVDPLEEVAEAIIEARGSAIVASGDVTDRRDVGRVVAAGTAAFGSVDVLINNAVMRSQRPFLEMSLDEWQGVLDVTLTGAFHCSQAVIPGMLDRGFGRIISMSGISGQTGVAERAGVSAAKAGLIGFTRALAAEFANSGITVNAMSPGGIATEKGDWTSAGDPEEIRKHYAKRAELIPMGRTGTVEEVATLALYLASEEAGFMTGQVLSLNGGTFMP